MSLEQRGIRPGPPPPEHIGRVVRRAIIRTVDGMEIRGVVQIPAGLRIMDLLNRETDRYIAVTEATVSVSGRTDAAPFLAVNKAHVITLREPPDNE